MIGAIALTIDADERYNILKLKSNYLSFKQLNKRLSY